MLLKKTVTYGFLLGLPLSILYAWSTVNGHPFGTAAHTAIYTASVYPSGFAYVSAICLLYLHGREWRLWRCLAAPGRMALTNYIAFYVFLVQMAFSVLWLSYFRFGPLEWGWRMLTYGKWLKIRK